MLYPAELRALWIFVRAITAQAIAATCSSASCELLRTGEVVGIGLGADFSAFCSREDYVQAIPFGIGDGGFLGGKFQLNLLLRIAGA